MDHDYFLRHIINFSDQKKRLTDLISILNSDGIIQIENSESHKDKSPNLSIYFNFKRSQFELYDVRFLLSSGEFKFTTTVSCFAYRFLKPIYQYIESKEFDENYSVEFSFQNPMQFLYAVQYLKIFFEFYENESDFNFDFREYKDETRRLKMIDDYFRDKLGNKGKNSIFCDFSTLCENALYRDCNTIRFKISDSYPALPYLDNSHRFVISVIDRHDFYIDSFKINSRNYIIVDASQTRFELMKKYGTKYLPHDCHDKGVLTHIYFDLFIPKNASLLTSIFLLQSVSPVVKALSESNIDLSVFSPCDHGVVFPKDAVESLTPRQVRLTYPRLNGECPLGCGFEGVYYASREHYMAGDW